MNVNLYKIDEDRLKNNDMTSYLSSEEYINDLSFISSAEDSDDDLNVGVWIESRERESTDWQNEVQRLIRENEKENKNIKIFEDLGRLYNVIIIVECQNDIYALHFGHAYNTVVKVCDREFGMNIASRQIKKSDVSREDVNKYFSNVIAQQTYYSQSTEISIDYFESYEGITGKPKNEVFGRTITCSHSVRFNASRLEDVRVSILFYPKNVKR